MSDSELSSAYSAQLDRPGIRSQNRLNILQDEADRRGKPHLGEGPQPKGRKTPAAAIISPMKPLSRSERASVADALEQFAEGVRDNLSDDHPGEDEFPVVDDYLNDADRIRAGEAPVHAETREALAERTGPAAHADDVDAYLALVRRMNAKRKA